MVTGTRKTPPETEGQQQGWYLVAKASAVKPGRQIRRLFQGKPVLIGRTDRGDLFAIRDICPHRLVPLSAGKQIDTGGETTVECPYHGWRFGTDGVCRLIPSLMEDDPYTASDFVVARYGVNESAGCVFLSSDTDANFEAAITEGVLGEPRIWITETITLPGRIELPPFAEHLGWASPLKGERTWKPESLLARRLSKEPAEHRVTRYDSGPTREALETEKGVLDVLISICPDDHSHAQGHILMWWTAPAHFSIGGWDLRAAARQYLRKLSTS